MRHLPSTEYSGLTIVLSHQSRHDSIKLISGTAGTFFDYHCLRKAGINREACDVRTSDTKSLGLLHSTRAILLLGHRAMVEWTKDSLYTEYTLGELRGTPLETSWPEVDVCIASYLPQDALDPTSSYEQQNNPHLQNLLDDEEDSAEGSSNEKLRHGKTKRKNWSFWLQRDTAKIASAVFGQSIRAEVEFRNKIYPTVKEIEQLSYERTNQYLYLDIETFTETEALDISVISFALDSDVIYTIPFIRYNYTLGYSHVDMCRMLVSIARLMQHNIPVLHNAMFDLFVLAHRYKIPVGPRIEDTMLMWHRLYPEADKSLGHVMSTLTWEPYHKADGIFNPKSSDQEQQLWLYNSKDVHGTRLCHLNLRRQAQRQFGMQESMAQANSMIRPYLINTLFGLRFDEDKRKEMLAWNDRMLTQLLRICNLLVGPECMQQVRPVGSSSVLPSSSAQCVKYFHDILGYPVVGRSKKTGRPSLDEKAFMKLALKLKDLGIDNPMIQLVLEFRRTMKESGSLRFIPWKE